MELLFRKYFWAFNVLFILLATLIAASTVNLFVESAIAPTAVVSAARAPKARAPEKRPELSLPRLASLTGLPLPKAPEPELARAPEVDLNAPPVKSSLRVRLLGTLLAPRPEWSMAFVEDGGTQKAQTYMVHDQVQGAEVLSIERNRVIVLNNGHREYIGADMNEGPPPPIPVSTPVRAPANEPGTVVTGSNIRALDENNYEVPRAEIDKTLSNLNDVAMQARIVPAFKDGQAEGFKLFSIRPDSIYTHIGVQNGDVIRRINGYDMNSPEKALEVYSKLRDASRIEIELDRNGSIIRKTYNIR